jgi:glutamine synthetase
MSVNREQAINIVLQRKGKDVDYSSKNDHKVSAIFGQNVFDDEAMLKYMPEDVFYEVKNVIKAKAKLNRDLADKIASAMKSWAMDKGATHFAHWFQPLTGKTAEKHDSFFTLDRQGKAIEEFGGNELAQQEPDGSSFPGGGLRSTFEARGYTAWDPSSNAFIMEVGNGKTLCIPTIFVTYGGDALDYKLPLLKSEKYLESAAIEVAKYFVEDVTAVNVTLGWEQEYFVIDEAFYIARPDLVMTGRTLIGKHSNKGQQLDDHYFGSIPERIYKYMLDLETEAHKLGIPVRTRHNEVGPGQYELAPMFEAVNKAVDHNQLLMDMMERVAKRHGLRVLLHEKPFDGVNGSGKHNNWSISTDTGLNLLKPGAHPGKNLRFLTFFVNTIASVHQFSDILRASVASASNDHRLGANEAPPAIISVFIGTALTDVLDRIENGEDSQEDIQEILNLLENIPDLELDNTDRNRTSPFAFTGNKFEFRMPGSSINSSAAMTALNTMMGWQLRKFVNDVQALKDKGDDQQRAIYKTLKKYIKESKSIRFEGDNYSDEWVEEAESRGLSNNNNTPDALNAYMEDKSIELFTSSGVFTERELRAHFEVMQENYILKRDIESRTLEEICLNYVIPAAIRYQNELLQNIDGFKEAGFKKKQLAYQMDVIERIQNGISNMHELGKQMTTERHSAHELDGAYAVAAHFAKAIVPLMSQIREEADELELLVADDFWILPKYREMMFLR